MSIKELFSYMFFEAAANLFFHVKELAGCIAHMFRSFRPLSFQ